MDSLKPYAEYKPSGVDWLGDIPKGWEVKRLKFVVININKKCYDEKINLPFLALEHIESWTGKCRLDYGSQSDGQPNVYQKNDVLFCKLRPYLAKAYLASEDGICTSELLVLRSEKDVLPSFLHKFLLTKDVIEKITGSTFGAKMPRANWDYIGNLPFSLPSLPEQQAIAHFLDQKCARIGSLIKKKQQFLELLEEKRRTLITHAVTRGLDASSPLKASGVDWLGDIPTGWEVKRLGKICIKINSGKTPSGGAEVYESQGILFLRSQNVYDTGLELQDSVFITEEIDDSMKNSRVLPHDILLNITGASLGRTCLVPSPFCEANVNQHVCIIRLQNTNHARYVSLFLKSQLSKAQIEYSQNGAAREGLPFTQIAQIALPFPPLPEQQAIVDYLDTETATIDTQKKHVQASIELLKEYRASLITHAVTGKIDVRAMVTP